MAIIDINNNYIRVTSTGLIEIYESEEQRLINKSAPSYSEIQAKYEELISEAFNKFKILCDSYNLPLAIFCSPEYSDLEKIPAEVISALNNYYDLTNEQLRYEKSFKRKDYNVKLPIMSTFFPQVLDSIPRVLTRFSTDFTKGGILEVPATAAEAYELVKKDKMFKVIKNI